MLHVVTVMLVEQLRTIGGHVWLIVTAKEQLVVLPQASVAVHVTRVLAFALKQEPLGGLQVTVTGPQPPEAELEKNTGTQLLLHEVLMVMFVEQVSTIGEQ